MGLPKKEIEQLINKLRMKYREHAHIYKSKLFNIEAFEDRLQMALRNRMNLEGFILAEIANFEKIKEKYDENQKQKNAQDEVDPFTLKVNKMMEDNISRMTKYREISFHDHAGIEISHFYGALSDLTEYYFSIFRLIVNDPDLKSKLHLLEERLRFHAVQQGSRHPKRIQDHILVLSRREKKEIEVEKDKNDYLKEGAFLLHEIIEFTERLLDLREKEWNNPLRFDRLYVHGEAKKKIIDNFNSMTPYGAILKVNEMASNIIKDFRLESFKKNV